MSCLNKRKLDLGSTFHFGSAIHMPVGMPLWLLFLVSWAMPPLFTVSH